MPCNSEHMNARPNEVLSRETAILIVYANNKLGVETPDNIVTAANEYYGDETHVDAIVETLCTTIRSMTKEQIDTIVYDGRDPTARKLADWWMEHVLADEKRAAAEARAEADRLQAAALLSATKKIVILETRTGPDANTVTLTPAEQAALLAAVAKAAK